jgi:hypothetical protein
VYLAEVQLSLSTVSQTVKPLRKGKHITWILDSGFDDIAMCRLYYTDRLEEFEDYAG